MAVTRNDVARRAGVSPGLVSYVLNGGPRPVSSEARARIEAAIQELGYRPDGIARYLKTGKTNSLGLVLPDIGLPYYSEITKELNALAYAHGFQLLIATTELDISREDAQLASLAERRVDAIILMSVDPEGGVGVMDGLGTRVVLIDRPQFAIESARVATAHLHSHGHRDIGFVGSGKLRASQRRLQGWSQALAENGLKRNEQWIASAPITRAGGYAAAMKLFSTSERPTALLIGSDAQAAGALRALRDLGIDVPGDVSIVTSEGTDLAKFTIPSLTSVVQPISTIASDAIETALAQGMPEVKRIDNVNFDLALRQSCGH